MYCILYVRMHHTYVYNFSVWSTDIFVQYSPILIEVHLLVSSQLPGQNRNWVTFICNFFNVNEENLFTDSVCFLCMLCFQSIKNKKKTGQMIITCCPARKTPPCCLVTFVLIDWESKVTGKNHKDLSVSSNTTHSPWLWEPKSLWL